MAFLQFGNLEPVEVQHLPDRKVAFLQFGNLEPVEVQRLPDRKVAFLQFGNLEPVEVQHLPDKKVAKIYPSNKKVAKIYPSNKKVAKIPYTNLNTSLGCTSSIQRSFESSIIQCASKEESGLLLHALRKCGGPFVVEGLHVHGCKLIVGGRVGLGVKITMKEEHDRWSVTHTWDQSLVTESWWERSKGMFTAIFRDIVFGLSCLFEKGYFCGSLTNGGVSIRDGRAKILIAREAKSSEELEDRMKVDLRDLHDLMVYSLTLANSGNIPNARYFEAQHIGEDVLDFLHRLNNLVHFEKVYVLWALDHPVFWTSALKKEFIFKLWQRMSKSGVGTLSPASLDKYLQSIYVAFPKYLTMDAYVIKVKEFCEAEDEEYSRKTHMKGSKSDSFEIVRIYRDCIHHYNRYLCEDQSQKKRISWDEISTIADTMLKVGVCTELTNAVGYAWRISKDDGMRKLMEYVHSSKAG